MAKPILVWRFTMRDGSGLYNSNQGYIPSMREFSPEQINRYTIQRPAPGCEPRLLMHDFKGPTFAYIYGFGSVDMAKRWFDIWQDLETMARNGARLRAFRRADAFEAVDGDWQTLFHPKCSRFADFPADALYSMSAAALTKAALDQIKAKPCHSQE